MGERACALSMKAIAILLQFGWFLHLQNYNNYHYFGVSSDEKFVTYF